MANKQEEKQYLYSEIFNSIQGEGFYTGYPTVWYRSQNCNMQCDAMGQKDPTNPETWILPYKDIDVSKYKKIEDLPVFKYGCDSSYSWSKKFRHLNHKATPTQIAQRLRDCITNEYNPNGSYKKHHLCFTGGEPLLRMNQQCSIDVMKIYEQERDIPLFVTYETNGTQILSDNFIEFYRDYRDIWGGELFFSVSPKLKSVSGEENSKALKPEIVNTYYQVSEKGQLKFVINGSDESWKELERTIEDFRNHNIDWDVWIMPVGATVEDQEQVAGDIASEALKRGYNVSARVHAYLWGNKIGT